MQLGKHWGATVTERVHLGGGGRKSFTLGMGQPRGDDGRRDRVGCEMMQQEVWIGH